jgi:hypothetical protein
MRFFQSLDPLFVAPHRVAFMRIIRLLEQAVFREYHRIVKDNVLLYGTDFVSTNSDFYTNKERRESFGCLVGNMLAQQYVLEVRLFVAVVSVFVLLSNISHSNFCLLVVVVIIIGWTTTIHQ